MAPALALALAPESGSGAGSGGNGAAPGLGVACLDALHGGRGLAPGAVAEVVASQPSRGTGALIAALVLASASGERPYPLALIDGADSFDPASLRGAPPGETAGLCHRLLWVRCRHRADHAIKAADLLLRDGNLPVVALDLQLCPLSEARHELPGGIRVWHRLRSLAEQSGTILLVFTDSPLVPSASWRLELDQRWHLADVDRPPASGDWSREPLRLAVTRSRGTASPHAHPLAAAC